MLAGFLNLANEDVNLLKHSRFKVSHRFVINSLSDEAAFYTVLSFVKSVEYTGVPSCASKQVDA